MITRRSGFNWILFGTVVLAIVALMVALAGDPPCASAQQACTVGDDALVEGNFISQSGTAFNGTFDHAITADRTWTLPNATDTLVGRATTDTLTNKSLTAPTITGAPTAAGATWADLGSVSTIDINGGTVDGVTLTGGTFNGTIGGTPVFSADHTYQDNVRATFGDSGDADIYYDGTDLRIDPQVVGSGSLSIDEAGSERITIGLSESAARISQAAAQIHYSGAGGSAPFDALGNLVLIPRSSAPRAIVLMTGSTSPITRLTIDSTGDFNFNNGDLNNLGNAGTDITSTGATFSTGIPVTVNDTTVSSSKDTGALVVNGGVGIEEVANADYIVIAHNKSIGSVATDILTVGLPNTTSGVLIDVFVQGAAPGVDNHVGHINIAAVQNGTPGVTTTTNNAFKAGASALTWTITTTTNTVTIQFNHNGSSATTQHFVFTIRGSDLGTITKD